MDRLKIVTIVGTRPEIIRLSRVLAILDQETDHVLVHTGQNYDYELNQIFFDDLGLRHPDHILDIAGDTSIQTISNVLTAIEHLLIRLKPDAVLVLGDTNSGLSVLSAKRLKIPVFHMEAGNRCFDDRVPEEINRRIIDHVADINMPYSEAARRNLLSEGIPSNQIIKTGSPMAEVLAYYDHKIRSSTILEQLSLKPRQYYVVSCHREENVDSSENLERLISLLEYLSKRDDGPVMVSAHPRLRKRLNQNGAKLSDGITLLTPLNFTNYVGLQNDAIAVLSDSGTISEESSILNFPAVNLRESHERSEAMDEGSVMMTGLDLRRVEQALNILSSLDQRTERTARIPSDYEKSTVSTQVLHVIVSYINFVNARTWRMNWGHSVWNIT